MAIVFDLGGVLIDWNPRHLYQKLFDNAPEPMERFLSDICSQEWNVQQDAGRPFAEGIAELVARHPDFEQLIRAYDTRWEEMIAGAIQPSVDILADLKQANHPLYALSNWSAEKFANMRNRFPFLSWFEIIVISGEVKAAKPDPRIFSFLLEKSGRTARECLFIDDSIINIAAAQKLGFKTIHFLSPEQLRAELLQMGILKV